MEQREPGSLDRLKVCVIIPTYNNAKTLARVLDSVLEFTSNIIVVNDGSTDDTHRILQQYPQPTIITIKKNAGKGNALRNGFKKANALHYNYAITIDSDGQHFPSDIPKFIDALEIEGDAILIGSRNMSQKDVPKKSSFGNKFSNFWFWFETGIRLEDTQSGFRLYPLKIIPKKFFTTKFEFEIEVIVRAAWRGIPVRNIPIKVLYDPAERVSHFRPFKDFSRISVLNTILVFVTVFHIKPRDFFRGLKKKGWKKFFLDNVIRSEDSNVRKASSIALGTFIGISPFWGFQTVLVLFLAVLLRLNKAISFTFSNISFPPLIPFIIYGSLKIGSYFVHTTTPLILNTSLTFTDLKDNINQYLIGSFILAAITAIAFGTIGYFAFTLSAVLKNRK